MGFLHDLDRFLTRLFSPGAVAVDRSTYDFGVPTEDFTPADYGGYLAVSAGVYVCAKKRATLLSSLPLELTRLRRDGEADAVTSGSLYDLTRKVNRWWTWRRLIEMTEMSLCAWGVSYWYVVRRMSGTGEPQEIFWMRPDRMRVFPHPTEYVDHFEYQPPGGGAPIPYKPSEIIWFRYPNPLDEYSGLSPLAAARLAADTQSAAMKANRNLFSNGLMGAGFIAPSGPGVDFDAAQAKELAEMLEKRFKGVDKAHRVAVLRADMKAVSLSLNPKDAEYIALHKLTLEDIARAYGIPLDLIGGQRTFENYDAAVKSVWNETILPEAAFIADELTEQLLPMFPRQADLCGFDHSHVKALQDDEHVQWQIAGEQITKGAIVINEWRTEQGKEPVPWGDVPWFSIGLVPIHDDEPPEEPVPEEPALPEPGVEDAARMLRALGGTPSRPMLPATTRLAYGSPEHQRLFGAFVRRTEGHEAKVKTTVRRLLQQQEQSILTELGKASDSIRMNGNRRVPVQSFASAAGSALLPGNIAMRAAESDDADSLMAQIFSISKWRRRFRETIRPVLATIILDAGQQALDEVAVGTSFDVTDPHVGPFLQDRTQRFAVQVNETTWDALKASLGEGLDAGEGVDVLKERVRVVMGDRIRSSAETIARTETISSYTGGYIEGARQSGQIDAVQWISALDDRTRETHVIAHGQVVPIGRDFEVGAGHGPGPGLIDLPEESVNCRCSLLSILTSP